jgi:ADP-ribose pyrophosphatase YjhB (NUDIX family)
MTTSHYAFSDKEYGRVLDNFVIACVDVVVLYQDKILLERRGNDPIKNQWWIFGGRMSRGDSLIQAAKKELLKELGLKITDTTRIKELGAYNLVWPTRREPDAKNGCHHLLVAHVLRLNEKEYQQINESPRKTMNWFDIFDIGEQILPDLRSIIDKTIELCY